jgi:hypothetical protein
MEDSGDQFGSIPKGNPTTEATTKDVVQSKEAPGLSHGHMADTPAGDSLLWKQKQLKIIQLITSPEDASNQHCAGMTVFVERTTTIKKVCTPCSPRAP